MNLYILYCFTVVIFISNTTSWSISESVRDSSSGSVLFWSHDHEELTRAKELIRLVIPSKSVNADNDDYVLPLIEYLRWCFQSEPYNNSSGVSRDVFQAALADAVGEYMHHYVVPVTKRAYYVGNVRYDHAKVVINFYDEIKHLLHTNGRLWSAPVDAARVRMTVEPMSEQSEKIVEDPCSFLITNEHIQDTRFPPGRNGLIPLPFLDNALYPSVLAIPFRTSSLRRLSSPFEGRALESFYTLSTQCMKSRYCSVGAVVTFQRDFYQWLKTEVVPHLTSDEWYPALGGVLQLVHTLQPLVPFIVDYRWLDAFWRLFSGFSQTSCQSQEHQPQLAIDDMTNIATLNNIPGKLVPPADKWYAAVLRRFDGLYGEDGQKDEAHKEAVDTKAYKEAKPPQESRDSYSWLDGLKGMELWGLDSHQQMERQDMPVSPNTDSSMRWIITVVAVGVFSVWFISVVKKRLKLRRMKEWIRKSRRSNLDTIPETDEPETELEPDYQQRKYMCNVPKNHSVPYPRSLPQMRRYFSDIDVTAQLIPPSSLHRSASALWTRPYSNLTANASLACPDDNLTPDEMFVRQVADLIDITLSSETINISRTSHLIKGHL